MAKKHEDYLPKFNKGRADLHRIARCGGLEQVCQNTEKNQFVDRGDRAFQSNETELFQSQTQGTLEWLHKTMAKMAIKKKGNFLVI